MCPVITIADSRAIVSATGGWQVDPVTFPPPSVAAFGKFTHYEYLATRDATIQMSSHFSGFADKSLVKSIIKLASPVPRLTLSSPHPVRAPISLALELTTIKYYFSFASPSLPYCYFGLSFLAIFEYMTIPGPNLHPLVG